MKRDLTELNKLEQYLKEHNLPYERIDEDEDVIEAVFNEDEE